MIFPKALLKCWLLCFIFGVTDAQDDKPFPASDRCASHLGIKAFPYSSSVEKKGIPHFLLGRGSLEH